MRYTKPQVVTTCRATANIQNVGAQKGSTAGHRQYDRQLQCHQPSVFG
jgi:hypothetical protein